MKKILVFILSLITLVANAQKSKVESAAIYLRNSEIESAKTAVDEAVQHPDTKEDAKAWFYYISVYDTIYRNPAYERFVSADFVNKFYTACANCVKYDTKDRYSYYCKDMAIINSAFMAFNKGIESYEAKNYNEAIKYYQIVLDVIPFDKNGDLRKNNLAETNVVLYMAYAAIQGEDRPAAKKYLNKLMELNYDDPIIYIQTASMYLEEKDTATSLSYIEKGRIKYPNNKDLINQELNIYIAQGKQDLLLEKLNAAIEANPYNSALLFVRGNVYDNFATDATKKYKQARETETALRKKALQEKVAAKKQSLNNEASGYEKEQITHLKKVTEYTKLAETDYVKVLEFDPTYIDAYYNLGAITNNKTTNIAEKINNISASTQSDYDKKYKPLKAQQDSILGVALKHFTEALNIAEQKPEDTEENKKIKNAYLKDILFNIQQVYANMGEEKKSMDARKRREAIK